MYTDGLIENEGPDHKRLRIKQVGRIFQNAASLELVCEEMLAAGRTIWQEHPAEDDCTFLCLEWKGPDSEMGVA